MSVPYVLQLSRGVNPKRLHGQAATIALKTIARHHLGTPMGLRFKGGSETKPGGLFGFVERSTAYDKQKQQQRGHTAPLRGFTDKLRNGLQRTSKVTATQHRAVIRLRSPHPLKPEQWQELTFVAIRESSKYAILGNQVYATAMQGLRNQQAQQRSQIS